MTLIHRAKNLPQNFLYLDKTKKVSLFPGTKPAGIIAKKVVRI